MVVLGCSVLTLHSSSSYQSTPIWFTRRRPSPPPTAASARAGRLRVRRNWAKCGPRKTTPLTPTATPPSTQDSSNTESPGVVLLPLAKLHATISAIRPVVLSIRSRVPASFVAWISLAAAVLIVAVRVFVVRKSRFSKPPGTVADLVRRGQLRSDTRGMSRTLKYDDPFDNPYVKINKTNNTVEMCGKRYRLAPVTLTREEQSIHQKRRSRAYQWKRPTVFLKEGDPVPPDVDPDTVRWIPANHPFATTTSDIDEGLAQNNVYQKHGVPSRIRAEHEALQLKLEALQNDQNFDKIITDAGGAKDFEREFKLNSKTNGSVDQSATSNHVTDANITNSDLGPSTSSRGSSSDEMQKP